MRLSGNVCWPITSQVSGNRTSSCKDPALTCAASRKGHTATRLQSVGKLQAFERAGWVPQTQEHVFQHPLPALPMTRARATKITFGCRGRRTKGNLEDKRLMPGPDSSHSEHSDAVLPASTCQGEQGLLNWQNYQNLLGLEVSPVNSCP